MQHMIKMLQSDLKTVDERLVALNKQKQKHEYSSDPVSVGEQEKREA